MTHSRNLTKSNKKRDLRLGNKRGLEHRVADFVDSAHKNFDPEKEEFLARKIGEFKGSQAKVICAQALTEIALRHSSSLQSKTSLLFSDALDSSFQAEQHDPTGFYTLQSKRLQRQISIAAVMVTGELPDAERVSKVHDSNVSSIGNVFTVWDKVKRHRIEEAKNLKGFMSEEAVQLLLERYAVHSIGEGWVPTYSTLSEGRGKILNGRDKTGWNLSIFSDSFYESGEPTHKLQIMTRSCGVVEKYAEGIDIDFVPVTDLPVSWDRNKSEVMPQYILNEMLSESEGNRTSTHRLNERTEVLLDIFS